MRPVGSKVHEGIYAVPVRAEEERFQMLKHGHKNSLNLRSADVLCDSLHILKEFVQLQRRNVRVP